MIFVINDGGKLSPKMNLIVQVFQFNSKEGLMYIFRNGNSRFEEKWGIRQIDLATSISSNFMHFLLMFVRSPKSLHDGLLRRFFPVKTSKSLVIEGFLSSLSQVLSEYFDKRARTNNLINFLKKLDSPVIFLVDEFVSIGIVNLKILKLLGQIVYVSQDVACDHFNFENNIITKKLIYKLEREAVGLSDLVVACSERDRLKYLEMGAKRVLFYPNIYPIKEFELAVKDSEPSICIALQDRWGQEGTISLEEIFKALSYINKKIKVTMIGLRPQSVPKNINMKHYGYIRSRSDFLKILTESWIGINVGIHLGGTNERKYDYAMAGLVVFSDSLGSRGDLLPHEYTYIDRYDLAGKLEQLLELGKDAIVAMGKRNRKKALLLAEKKREDLLQTLSFSLKM